MIGGIRRRLLGLLSRGPPSASFGTFAFAPRIYLVLQAQCCIEQIQSAGQVSGPSDTQT